MSDRDDKKVPKRGCALRDAGQAMLEAWQAVNGIFSNAAHIAATKPAHRDGSPYLPGYGFFGRAKPMPCNALATKGLAEPSGMRATPASAHLASRLRILRPACSLVLLFLLIQGSFAAVRTWDGTGADNNASTPANWVGDTAPVAGDDIVLDGTTNKNMTWDLNLVIASWTQAAGYDGTATVATVYGIGGFTNLNITGNCTINDGILTHNANNSAEVNWLSMTIAGDLSIGVDGTISANGKGYGPNQGPGTGTDASHGGRGLSVNNPATRPCYGSITAPTNMGCGSWCAGGGAVRLQVAGATDIDGLICANGDPDTNSVSYHTGAGGSIHLSSGTITGTGMLQAEGGYCVGRHSPGGGGRISVVLSSPGADFSGFSGLICAYGGLTTGKRSAAGTVYLEKETDEAGRGELIIDNDDAVTSYGCDTDLNGLNAVTCNVGCITLTNAGVLSVGADDLLMITGTPVRCYGSGDEGIVLAGGSLVAPAGFAFSNYFIRVSVTGAAFATYPTLTVDTNAVLCLDQPFVMTNNLHIKPGGTLTHTANYNSETYGLNLAVRGWVCVETGGCVDVTSKGYAATRGPGKGISGSYGGRGGALNGPADGVPYGSLTAPTNLGSGGNSGAGGGAMIMDISGVLTNRGIVSADGQPGTDGTPSYYGGSGGSVNIIAGDIVGPGPIRANGGNCWTRHSPPGGGRVALVVTNAGADLFGYVGLISAYQGKNSGDWGGAGTVYLRNPGEDMDEGSLIIDNDDMTGFSTDINTNVFDTVVGDVIIRNGGYLLMDTNETLVLSGIWSNSGTFDARADSLVTFAGDIGSTSFVYGSTEFMGLICTNGGKTFFFEEGVTNSVAAGGKFSLGGAATTNLFLRSTTDGNPWYLNVSASADQSVLYVDVKDSDALSGVGAEISAMNSKDNGANDNWQFFFVNPGETNVWNGNSSTVWSFSGNWSLGRPPVDDDVIVIPSPCPRYPVLDDSRTVNGITIQSNASLHLAGFNLTVKADAVVAGCIVAAGTETVSFEADVDFSGACFTNANSTIAINGGAAQSVDLDDLSFHKVNVINSAGTVTFESGFSAVELKCEAPAGQRSMVFHEGENFNIGDLLLIGDTASTNIILRGSSGGQGWLLNVDGYQSVMGVNVQDSDASGGQTITATSSRNNGGNSNWEFDSQWATWMGTNSVYFDDEANWSPPAVPGAGSRVLAESANPMTITSAVTVLDMTVGGGAGAASVTANAPLTVVEDIVVLTNGTLALNRPCVVSNGFYVKPGGTLTHSANTTAEINKLVVTVHGTFVVDIGGLVDVTEKGYGTSQGPGTSNCGSHGGRGGNGYSSIPGAGPCYGSIIAPTNMGSGGSGTPGGGAVLLNVTGEVRHDGVIAADGGATSYNTGAGGSVFITCETLRGTGQVRADGGDITGHSPGGGGRISIVLTGNGADFSFFSGTLQAISGEREGNARLGGAGTIYTAPGGCPMGRGSVRVDNHGLPGTMLTDIPPCPYFDTNEVYRATFNVANEARLRITNDFTIGDIFLTNSTAILDLNTNVLHVNSFEHDIGTGVVTNYGQIIWFPTASGTVFMGW